MRTLTLLLYSTALTLALTLQGCSFLCMDRLSRTRHIARKGDTLNKLAITYYGSETKVSMLIDANPKIDPLEPLTAGTRVEIPVD